MYAAIDKSELRGIINAIPSKSFAHRILICAALCRQPTNIVGKLDSEDFMATKGCLQKLGVKFEEVNDGYIITPANKYNQNCMLDCGESGSTFRFLLPVIAGLGISATIEGQGRLAQRPMGELIDVLRASGVSISNDVLPLCVSGNMTADIYVIRGDISSQYISGLLLALPLLKRTAEIIITGERSSQSYIDITLDVMASFGVKINPTPTGYKIEAGQEYNSPKTIAIEGDWSNAACWLVAGALTGDITVTGLNVNSVQGDRYIVDILKNMGAIVYVADNSVRIIKSKLKCIEFDADNTPDLVPIVAVAAACAEGVSVIKRVDRLRLKESDRLAAIIDMLKRLKIKAIHDGALKIRGDKLTSAVLYGYNDHRLVMAGTIAATVADNTIIMGIEAVKKSYPEFF
ncbi:MAG: 3-phosphoshikimate 1-carboxyvinyltransferase, partial [Clostridia bacterium]|nr:3-phosphoshikimate 1-carboxyvinyltransferase [Clostridia bacterium]